jgi:AP-4 complex subunit beta-1
MNILEEYLKISSGAIVLGVTKVFINFTKDNEVLYPQVIKRLKDPLLTLLSSCAIQNTPEIQYSILCHIYFLILKGGRDTFSEFYKRFYAEYEEPLFIKKIKLKILVQIANDSNYFDILSEFEEYASEKSSTFGKYSIRKIGELALRVDSSLQAVIDILKKLLTQQVDYIVSESFCVLRDLLRKYPTLINEFLHLIESSIQIISSDPRGLSALIFIIGEFGSQIENAPYILEYLSKLEIHSSEFAYSLLLAGCKLFFKSPGEMQPILGKIFQLILNNYKDVDLRDRVYYYYNLMKKDINLAEYIICGQPNVVDYYYSEFDDDYIDQIFAEFNSLSIIYRKPEEKFIKYTPDDINEEEDDKGDEEDQIEDKPLPSANKADNQNSNVIIKQIPNINEETLKPDYSIDENTYQNLWGQYQTYVHQNYKMIGDEVEIPEYVDYLKSKNIFTKAYGTNNGVSTLFLFSCEKTADIVFITKLVLNANTRQIEYELKTSAQEYANNYNNYLYENVSPLIDQ